jgi:hypothetical protein
MAQTDSTVSEGQESANSASSSQTVSPPSFDPDELAAKIEAKVLAAIQGDPRVVKSTSDKIMNSLKKDKGFKDFLAEYRDMTSKGMTEKEIELEARLREIEDRGGSSTTDQSPGKVVEQVASDPVKIVISALGLNENDPEVTGILLGGDLIEKVAQLGSLAERKKKALSNPAIVSQPAGGGAPTGKMSEQVKQEKSARLLELYKMPTKFAGEIKKLEAELDAAWS